MTRKVSRSYSLSVVAPFFAVGSRFGSTKLAAAAIRGALTLSVLSALLLIAALPAQAQTETVLYNFTGGSDGAHPITNLTSDGAGNFYGTTMLGGAFGSGTVFELSPNGSGGWNETALYSFCSVGGASCTDGKYPWSYVMFDSVGNLYGTTSGGGPNGAGAVFELSPVGKSWTETVLCGSSMPENGLIMDPAGNLYGTTFAGGVFELSPSGGGWTEQVIYAPGDQIQAGLTMDAAGNIFSATYSTVFELSPNGNGGWNPTVIHTFTGSDGAGAVGTPVLDQSGNLYGTTLGGGAYYHGTVYKLSPGNGTWTEEVLYSFSSGKEPFAGIVFDAAGDIYGTTIYGGKYGDGTVFELVAPVGAGNYKEKILWSFNGTDGAYPYGSLILDSAGKLYGTTWQGGSSGAGVVFEVTPPAATTTTLTSSPNPSTYGQAVTFTAVVTSSAGAPPDGETITFKKGTTVLGTGSLSGGSASLTTSVLPAGADYIKAVYGGDTLFTASTSNTVKQVVKKVATATTLSSYPNPSTYGQAVTFTAVVTPAPPDGEAVTFKKGTTVLGTGALSGGSASFTTSALPVGTDYIKARYGGDTRLAGSTSKAVKQVVN